MDGIGFLVVGIAVAFNIVIIKIKFERHRNEDAIFDSILLAVITLIFSGSFGALVVGTTASAFLSLYFLASPPKFFSGSDPLEKFAKQVKRRRR